MMGFVTVSSMFVGNMVLLIVFVADGDMGLVLLPILGSLVTGSGLVRMMMVPAARRD